MRALAAGLCFTMLLAQPARQKYAHEGTSIEFSAAPLRAGSDVQFRFTIGDASGTAIRGAHPAAWMDAQRGGPADSRGCTSKAAAFIGGSILTPPTLDLNAYYVLAMNEDASISVVDPLFGFGGSKLLSMVFLKSPGEDWALNSAEDRLFVSMPDAGEVAVVDAFTWKVVSSVAAGAHPRRVALQPDEKYLWVAGDASVTAISTASSQAVAQLPAGPGAHDLAISDDSRFVFVTGSNGVSVIDTGSLQRVAELKTGPAPAAIAFSSLAKMAYVTDSRDGTITAIDGARGRIVARMTAEPGLARIRFAPGSRLGFALNPERDRVHILDAASNRIVQSAGIPGGPEQVSFSTELAYLRRRESETVLMIPLGQVGGEGQSIPLVDFSGGQKPFGKGLRASLADGIVQAPGANAVLVANPADRAIYFYKEGMAAPMGNFSNYGHEPRAVAVVDRSLRERAPGTYETVGRPAKPGNYDIVFFLDSPRIVHCFEVAVGSDPNLPEKTIRPIRIESEAGSRVLPAGQPVRVGLRVVDGATGQAVLAADLRALVFLVPGTWQTRCSATPSERGGYHIDFTPPREGVYFVHFESRSLGLQWNGPQRLTLVAKELAQPNE